MNVGGLGSRQDIAHLHVVLKNDGVVFVFEVIDGAATFVPADVINQVSTNYVTNIDLFGVCPIL